MIAVVSSTVAVKTQTPHTSEPSATGNTGAFGVRLGAVHQPLR